MLSAEALVRLLRVDNPPVVSEAAVVPVPAPTPMEVARVVGKLDVVSVLVPTLVEVANVVGRLDVVVVSVLATTPAVVASVVGRLDVTGFRYKPYDCSIAGAATPNVLK